MRPVDTGMTYFSGLLLAMRLVGLVNLGAVSVLFASGGLIVQEQDFRGLDIHGLGAIGVHITSGLLATALILYTWVSKTGALQALLAVTLCGFTFLQAWLGSSMTLAIHITGALVLTVISTWLTAWTFSSRRRRDMRRASQRRHHHSEGTSA